MNIETVTLGQVAVMVAFIVALVKGIDFIAEKYKKPTSDLEDKITKRLDSMQKDLNFVLKAVSQLCEHEATGNNANEMRNLHNEMQEYIISTRRG